MNLTTPNTKVLGVCSVVFKYWGNNAIRKCQTHGSETKPLIAQLCPCQKSPSQKTAIFTFVKTISGLPGSVFIITRYHNPRDHISRRKDNSGRVPFDLTADIILCVTSGVRAINATPHPLQKLALTEIAASAVFIL
jgi:hypothetical protein